MKKDISVILVVAFIVVMGAWLFKNTSQSPYQPLPGGGGKATEGEVNLKLGQAGTIGNLTLTPQSIVEDSRCAQGVQCIWAGTVKIRTDIVSGLGKSSQTLELGKTLTTEAEEVTLVKVTPYTVAGSTIKPTEYTLTYKVGKRPSSGGSTAVGGCYVGGCSGQICSDQPNMVSTCEYSPVYACYKDAKCERQSTGQCGWTQTQTLQMCIANARQTPIPIQSLPQ